jgi:hypothetical protein
MKKQIILLLISNLSFTYAMENNELSIFSLSSYVPTWFLSSQKSNESQLVIDLRTSKSNFESKLRFSYGAYLNGMTTLLLAFDTDTMKTGKYCFLQYCYHYKDWHNACLMHLSDLGADTIALARCQSLKIDGYSALGAAMLAKDVSSQDKRAFIKELIDYQFKPTLKDTQLAEFIFYDEIMKEEQSTELKAKKLKTKFIHLLHPESLAYWYIFPSEIKKLIAQLMIQVLKQEEDCWLLPTRF